METRDVIGQRLASIAAKHQVKILYACESGSRAWGFPSPDSDYDIRCIYAHPPAWYLSLEEGRDVIETPIEDSPAGVLDLGGWDLRKTLRLARKSNPVVWEWLQSPIVYQALPSANSRALRDVVDPFYSPIAACHHYLGLAHGTMERELAAGYVKIKQYFYMLRPILAAAWIIQYRSIPPMAFGSLLTMLEGQPDIRQCVDGLLERKQHTDERIPIARIPLLDAFLQKERACLQDAASRLPAANADPSRLDALFRQLLGV